MLLFFFIVTPISVRRLFSLLISPIRARYFLLSAQEKVPKEKGTPVHSSAIADSFRSSPIRGRAVIPDWLRYSVSANGNEVAGLGCCFGF